MKPKVLLVSHTYAAPINRAKLDALAEYVDLTAITPRVWRDGLFTLTSAEEHSGAYRLYLLPVHFSGHILRYWYSPAALGRIAHQVEPDIILVEEEPASLVLAQMSLLKRRAKLLFFTWENTPRRVGLPGIERLNLSRCDGAIAGNRQASEVLKRRGFHAPIEVIPQLGVDPGTFAAGQSTERAQLGLKGFVVGYVGRLVEEKGLRILLDACARLDGVQLLVVGSGPLKTELDNWASNSGHTERLITVPAVPHERIVGYLRAMGVLALPSLTTPAWKEQFGHVLIEAMACGVPVIGSNSGAIPEVIGEAGIIVPEGDISALANAIAALTSDCGRRKGLANAGRERVLAMFTHERIAAADAAFFQQVLAQ